LGKREIFAVICFSLIVFCSRLPFLRAGYGLDPDAWRVAIAARTIATTGRYAVSRFPGFPVQEYFYSLIWDRGPLAFNLVTALFSCIGFIIFTFILRELGSKDAILTSLTLWFVPVIYINSTTSNDFVWGLTFMLSSFYFVLKRKPLIAGILLGLSVGCRITNGAMLIPLALLLIEGDRKRVVKDILTFSLSTLAVSLIAYLPGVLEYKIRLFSLVLRPTGLLSVLQFGSIGVWGVIGLLALIISSFTLLASKNRATSIPLFEKPHLAAACATAMVIYIVAYLWLPRDSGYLTPLIPFLILLLGRSLQRPVFIILCVAILFSSFFMYVNIAPGTRQFSKLGSNLIFHQKRIEHVKFVNAVIAKTNQLEGKNVIITGAYLPSITASLTPGENDRLKLVYNIDASQLRGFLDEGYNVYYLPGQKEYHIQALDLDLEANGAKPFITP
jgi:hypothetical protein